MYVSGISAIVLPDGPLRARGTCSIELLRGRAWAATQRDSPAQPPTSYNGLPTHLVDAEWPSNIQPHTRIQTPRSEKELIHTWPDADLCMVGVDVSIKRTSMAGCCLCARFQVRNVGPSIKSTIPTPLISYTE